MNGTSKWPLCSFVLVAYGPVKSQHLAGSDGKKHSWEGILRSSQSLAAHWSHKLINSEGHLPFKLHNLLAALPLLGLS